MLGAASWSGEGVSAEGSILHGEGCAGGDTTTCTAATFSSPALPFHTASLTSACSHPSEIRSKSVQFCSVHLGWPHPVANSDVCAASNVPKELTW